MAKPLIAVFSGPNATIGNSIPLVTSNKGRLPGESMLPGKFDHLVGQYLYEPATVRIRKFSAHPLEDDAREVYHDDGKPYYEVELQPEDGPYLLPYMGRRSDGSTQGRPFEAADHEDPSMNYGGRQTFYPDASRIFLDIDRTIAGRDHYGDGNILDHKADYEFIRVLPPGGYTKKGERIGVDYFPYLPIDWATRCRDLATAANLVQQALSSGKYAGGIWLEGSPRVEETLYWLSLLVDTELPIAGNGSQRPHGQLANDGDRNVVDSVGYILSGRGTGMGVVGVQDEQVFAAREFKKADDRPGNYKATGGHGGILGTVGPPVTLWYRPNYKHTSTSEVNLTRLPQRLEFLDTYGDTTPATLEIKNSDGTLRGEAIPRVHIIKFGAYMDEDETRNPDNEVDIMARIRRAREQQSSPDPASPRLHGLVIEGTSPYAIGGMGQMAALTIAACSGLPVVRVGRSDPGGRVPTDPTDLFIEGSNLDTNKARLLLIAAMLKLGRLPRTRDPRNPTGEEWRAIQAKVEQFQEIFETH